MIIQDMDLVVDHRLLVKAGDPQDIFQIPIKTRIRRNLPSALPLLLKITVKGAAMEVMVVAAVMAVAAMVAVVAMEAMAVAVVVMVHTAIININMKNQ